MTDKKNEELLTPAERKYRKALKAQKEALQEIKEEKARQFKSLKEVFQDDYPRNEDSKPITLKQIKENYTIIRKDQLNKAPSSNNEEYDRLLNAYKKVVGRLRETADNIDRSQGYPKISDLSNFTKWVETFKSKN